MKYPYKIKKSITGKYELVKESDDITDQLIRQNLPKKFEYNYSPALVTGGKDKKETVDLPGIPMRELEGIFYESWVNTTKDGSSKPVLVFGGSGIGKTDAVNHFSRTIASGIPCEGTGKDERGMPIKARKFIDISKLESDNPEIFDEVLKNVGNYFLFYMITGSDITPDILRGIYKTTSKEEEKGSVGVLSGQVPKYLKLMMQKEAVGVLFLDEVNQAGENQKLLYQLLLGHRVSQYTLSKRIRMFAAGNIGSYYTMSGVVSNLSPAAMGRVQSVYLKVSPRDWVEYVRSEPIENRWGESEAFPEEIISFLFTSSEDFDTANDLFYSEPGEQGEQSSQRGWPNPRNLHGFGIELINIVSELKNKDKPLKGDLPSRSVLSFKNFEKDLIKKIEQAGARYCGIDWGQKFAKFFYYAKFNDIDQVIASEFTKKSKGDKEEALEPEEYWAKGYVITQYFNKIANTYKEMDEKTLYSHFAKLAQALFKYVPHTSLANLKEYLKKVTGDMNTKDEVLFHRFAGYIAKFKPRNEEEKVIVDKFKKEIKSLMINPGEENFLK